MRNDGVRLVYPIEPRHNNHKDVNTAGLSAFCHDLFSSFARSDQRQWGEVYVRGLLTVPGRKSISRISDLVAGGGAEQCLQQFVNQSTWEWHTVRRNLARRLIRAIQPRAWVIKEVVFPKNGDHSVGVTPQFAQSAGRLLNCQLGLAVFVASPLGSCPVNWRLLLPSCWDADPARRERVRLPVGVRHLPTWQHMLNAIDEMVTEWGLPPPPIVADVRHEQQVSHLVHALEARRLNYVLQVGESLPAITVTSAPAAARAQSPAEVISDSIRRNTITMSRWQLPGRRPGEAPFIVTRLPGTAMGGSRVADGRPRALASHPHGHHVNAPRHLAAEWSPMRRSSKSSWLTTLGGPQLRNLLDQISLYERVGADVGNMYSASGLRHFEGRSFPGWHHHVTLVSVAQAWGCEMTADALAESAVS